MPHTVRGLAASLGISKPATVKSLDKLEEWKLVERAPDRADGRSALLVTTPTGEARYREMTACLQRLIKQKKRRSPPQKSPAGWFFRPRLPRCPGRPPRRIPDRQTIAAIRRRGASYPSTACTRHAAPRQ